MQFIGFQFVMQVREVERKLWVREGGHAWSINCILHSAFPTILVSKGTKDPMNMLLSSLLGIFDQHEHFLRERNLMVQLNPQNLSVQIAYCYLVFQLTENSMSYLHDCIEVCKLTSALHAQRNGCCTQDKNLFTIQWLKL